MFNLQIIYISYFRWEWGINCEVWQEALNHHYSHNPHHPQYCPGQPMEQCYLEESVVDMLGISIFK